MAKKEEKTTKDVKKTDKKKVEKTEKVDKGAEKQSFAKKSDRKKMHGQYHDNVDVICICGATFTVSATVPGPIRVESCYQCHPTYNKDKEIVKVVRGRLEKFLEKQKKIEGIKKPTK